MLTSRLYKSKFIYNKKKVTIFEAINKNLIFVILLLLFMSFYLLSKTSDIFTVLKFNYFNKLLINNGFVIKNIEISGLNHLDKKYLQRN